MNFKIATKPVRPELVEGSVWFDRLSTNGLELLEALI